MTWRKHAWPTQFRSKEVKATMKKAREERPELTKDEVQSAIHKLQKCKASDNIAIRAEGIKTCDDTTKEMLRRIKQDDCTPRNTAKNSHKSDTQKKVEDVRNYHPIWSLPALYKLFSTFLCDRLYPRLDHVQPEDQGGFRRSYQTLDHLSTYRLTEQKCQECVKMWIVTLYFMKAVGSMSHNSTRNAIEQCGIESYCISLLKGLRRTKSDSLNRQRERYVRDSDKNKAERPAI